MTAAERLAAVEHLIKQLKRGERGLERVGQIETLFAERDRLRAQLAAVPQAKPGLGVARVEFDEAFEREAVHDEAN